MMEKREAERERVLKGDRVMYYPHLRRKTTDPNNSPQFSHKYLAHKKYPSIATTITLNPSSLHGIDRPEVF